MSLHHDDFQERIARILSGQGATKATVYVGQELSFTYHPANRARRQGATGQLARNAAAVLAFPASILAGVLGNGLQRFADFVFFGLPVTPENPDVDLVRVAMTTLCLTLVLTYLIGLRDRSLLVAKLLGSALGMMMFHNLVHLWPQIFDTLFSPLWVARMTTMTEPMSLLVRGITIAL